MSTSEPTLHDLYPGLPNTPTVGEPVPHETLLVWAQQFTDLMISAIPSGSIAPADYAGRAESALREVATATTYSEAVSLAVESLAPGQRGALQADGQAAAVNLGVNLVDPQVFGQWTELVGRDAVYIVAMTLVARRARRAATKSQKELF